MPTAHLKASSLRYTPLPRDGHAEREVEAAMRGEQVVPASPRAFAYMALQHGVAGLLVDLGATRWLPPETAAPLIEEARRQAALAMLRGRHLRDVFDGIRAARLRVLAVKGAHLACTVYRDAAIRECEDTDLLVAREDRPALLALLGRLGYEEGARNVGDDVLGQSTFEKPGAVASALDIHSRLLAPSLPVDLFSFEALWSRSCSMPAFGSEVRVPALADALMIAVVHQAAHHHDHAFLLWTYDVSLLLGTMGVGEAEAFADRAVAAGIPAQCGHPILDAQERFPTTTGALIRDRFLSAATPVPGGVRLAPGRPLRQLGLDLRGAGWRAALRLLRGHLFPPPAYMRRTFAPGSRLPLICLYAARILRGARKWL